MGSLQHFPSPLAGFWGWKEWGREGEEREGKGGPQECPQDKFLAMSMPKTAILL